MKKSVLFLTLLLIAGQLAACGAEKPVVDNTSETTAADTEASASEFVYEFTEDYGGSEYRILNAGDIYNMRAEITREELTGESLNDAMYERCRQLNEKLNVNIKETTKTVDAELGKYAQKIVLSGEDEYDTIYIPARDLYKFTESNMLYNLLDYSAFNFDKEWWLDSYNSENTINGKLFAAAGYSQLMVIDSIWCLFFNETMLENLELDMPYDLVRSGNWTLDRYGEYLQAGVQLNGDSSFKWQKDGTCIYGMSGCASDKFLIGTGERIIEEKDGKLILTSGSEHFYKVLEKMESIMTENDGRALLNTLAVEDDIVGNYLNNFEIGRALFVTAEISKTSRQRDKDYSYGIVPFPKYDENQSNYYSTPFYGTPCFTIPVTCSDPERSAVIGDALTYLSYDVVAPVYRETTLEQKGLRNDDSIEMLDIIIQSSVPDLVRTYNIGAELRTKIDVYVAKGNNAFASLYAEHEIAMQTELDKINSNQ